MSFQFSPSSRFVVLALTVVVGCGGVTGDPFAIPDSPDGTVEVVLGGLVRHHPEVVWRALPASYQRDVNDLTRDFADAVDPIVFDRAVAVARKGAVVIQSKKDLILGSEIFDRAPIERAEIEAFWEASVHILDALLASDIADLRTLRELDVDAWLAATGSKVMDQAALLPVENEEMENFAHRVAAFEQAEIELVSEDGDHAVVMVQVPDEEPIGLELVRVEGRWIPAELATRWPQAIADAEAKIRSMASDEEDVVRIRMQVLIGIAVVEGFVDQIGQMETSEEFESLIGGMLGNFMPMQGDQPVIEG